MDVFTLREEFFEVMVVGVCVRVLDERGDFLAELVGEGVVGLAPAVLVRDTGQAVLSEFGQLATGLPHAESQQLCGLCSSTISLV